MSVRSTFSCDWCGIHQYWCVLMLQFEIVSCDNLYDLEGENDSNADGMIVDFV